MHPYCPQDNSVVHAHVAKVLLPLSPPISGVEVGKVVAVFCGLPNVKVANTTDD